jgi:CDP-diacylglycerol--glycerol-3-phosphate 3-phosphatidyltransferase
MLGTTPSNVLTFLRIAMVPAFVAVLWPAKDGTSNVAAGIFWLAAVTDFVDGRLARARNEISELGAVLDPLADRLLVASAVILLAWDGRLPIAAALLVLARDLGLVVGFAVLRRMGQRPVVSPTGKVASATIMGGLFFLLLEIPDDVGIAFFYVGVGLSLASGLAYVRAAFRHH